MLIYLKLSPFTNFWWTGLNNRIADKHGSSWYIYNAYSKWSGKKTWYVKGDQVTNKISISIPSSESWKNKLAWLTRNRPSLQKKNRGFILSAFFWTKITCMYILTKLLSMITSYKRIREVLKAAELTEAESQMVLPKAGTRKRSCW